MIDLSQEACDKRLVTALRFITENYSVCWDQTVWGTTQADPTQFDPNSTSCGTIGCLAGWGAIQAGLAGPADHPLPGAIRRPTALIQYEIVINEEGQRLIRESGRAHLESRKIQTDFFTLGMIIFGLGDVDNALALFNSSHSLGSLWSYAAIVTNGRVSLTRELEQFVINVDASRYERFRR